METFYERFDNNFFNKEFSPFRSLIFSECQTSHLSKLIKILDYETNFYSKNYRLGIRYFDSKNMEFSWKTTNNGKMLTKFFSKKDWEYCEYNKNMYFSEDIVKKNCFSHNKKNRKLSFYYKTPENFRDVYDNCLTSIINIYKMNNSIYGLSKKIISDVLWFDIDNHDFNFFENVAIRKFKKLMEILNITEKDFMYIEGNYFNGGLHCAIKLPYKVDQKFYELLEKELKKRDCDIECNFTNKILRLPCSYEYAPLNKGNIQNKQIFELSDYEQNIKEYIENINITPVNSQFLNEILSITNPNLYSSISSKFKMDNIRKLVDNYQNQQNLKGKNYWNNSRELFIKELNNKISNKKELYKITKGHRWETLSNLIPYMYLQGLELNEVLNKIQELNIDSEDMKNFNKLIPEITSFYNKCKKTLKRESKGIYQKYISNQNKLSEITLQFFENEDFKRYLTEKFIKHYIKERNYKNNYISSEKYEVLIKVIPFMIKEIIGKMYYHVDNKKTFKKESMNVYNGFQLSYKEIELIQDSAIKFFNLEDNSLAKTSIQYLKKCLLKTLDIEEIKLIKHKRNWINGSCKSFRINSIADINSILTHLYNSCFKDIVNKKFILTNNKIYILYILLIDNWEIYLKNEVDFITEHIPINLNSS